jgi:hypothetical protein
MALETFEIQYGGPNAFDGALFKVTANDPEEAIEKLSEWIRIELSLTGKMTAAEALEIIKRWNQLHGTVSQLNFQ